MRTVLNKSGVPVDDKLQKALTKVHAAADKIQAADPEIRQSYIDGIAKAQEAYRKAEEAKEEADTEREFDQASDDAQHALKKEEFFRRHLNAFDHTPRMDEKEYSKHVKAMTEARDRVVKEYRQKAIPLMDELKKVHDDYLDQAAAINAALETLDQAANVLQSKYPAKTVKRVGMEAVQVPDPNAWRDHAVRFDSYEAYRAATCPDPVDKTENPSALWDSVLVSAWTAITKGFPKKVY